MKIQCECAKFSAEVSAFPAEVPGRLVCYCDDCQTYLQHLKRGDLLDSLGGTEIIPVYPVNIQFLTSSDQLRAIRLSPRGMFRFSTLCCNTPIANVRPNTPWVGVPSHVFFRGEPNKLSQALGPVRARIMGKFAQGSPPQGTAPTFNLKAFLVAIPFILKGKIFKKESPSPFFKGDQNEPVCEVRVLTQEERREARTLALTKNKN